MAGCAGLNGNLSAPPALTVGSHLGPGSPCLDAGPGPATYAGLPLTDLAGNIRLRDYDGDGLARGDMGAFEQENTTLTPGEVTGVRWTDTTHLVWDSLPAAVEYHRYRGTRHGVSYAPFGSCYDTPDPLRTDTTLIETAAPPAGQGWFCLVTGEDSQGSEGTLGFAAGTESSNFASCP